MNTQQLNKAPMSAHIAVLITCFLWSTAFVVIRYAMTYFTASSLAFLRYAVASLVMVFFYFLRTRHNTVRLKDLLWIGLLGIIGIAIYNVMLNSGEVTLSSTTASFIIGQMPVMSTLLGIVFFKERLKKRAVQGLVLSIMGVLVIAVHGVTQLHLGLGLLMVCVATACGSIFSVFQKPLLKRVDPFQLTAWAIWIGTLSLLYSFPEAMHQLHTVPWQVTGWVVFIGVFPAAIAYALWSYGVSYLPVSRAGSYLFITPFLVLIFAWIFLGALPSILSLVGGVIALIGVMLIIGSK